MKQVRLRPNTDPRGAAPGALVRVVCCVLLALATAACTAGNPTPTTSAPTSADCAGGPDDDSVDDCPGDQVRHPPNGLPQLLPTPVPARPAPSTPIRVETVADGLSMPLGLAWTPDGSKLFFSEVKLGQIRVMVNGALQAEPFVSLPIAKGAETGMLGLAVDPNYDRNHFVYAYHSDAATARNRVLRFIDQGSHGGEMTEILRSVSISEGGIHNGGRLAFGPDGKLYVSVGNGQNPKIGQDICKLGGKILRVNTDGSRPADNPYDCGPTLAYGFRNPFGLAFHPQTGGLYVSDNGGRGHDELNLVQPRGNYGHALVEGIAEKPGLIDPLFETGPVSIGPTGLTIYNGDRLPEFENDLFFCGVHTGQLGQARLSGPRLDRIEALNVEILKQEVDCRLDVASGPDGALYFTNFSKIGRLTR